MRKKYITTIHLVSISISLFYNTCLYYQDYFYTTINQLCLFQTIYSTPYSYNAIYINKESDKFYASFFKKNPQKVIAFHLPEI